MDERNSAPEHGEHHKPPTDILLGLISLVLFTILGILAILATRRYGNRRNGKFL
jgi:hypothetical protein